MVTDKLTNKGAVSNYLTALLLDTQVTPPMEDESEPVFRFARVDEGFGLVKCWTIPKNSVDQISHNLILLSLTQKLADSKLRSAMLKTVVFGER